MFADGTRRAGVSTYERLPARQPQQPLERGACRRCGFLPHRELAATPSNRSPPEGERIDIYRWREISSQVFKDAAGIRRKPFFFLNT